jgi:hypothetical protein
LDPKSKPDGAAILAEIMVVAEAYRDKVTIILAGYQDDIEKKLFTFNVGLASRFEVIPRPRPQRGTDLLLKGRSLRLCSAVPHSLCR